MPNLAIPDSMLPDLTDDEVDYLAMYLNPRYENPTLPTDLHTIARRVCNMKIQGIANSKFNTRFIPRLSFNNGRKN